GNPAHNVRYDIFFMLMDTPLRPTAATTLRTADYGRISMFDKHRNEKAAPKGGLIMFSNALLLNHF
ncbi:hypothetical protein P8631_12385, partial [Guyparkeria sp. 1SP6A2]|nr:hypothetical protein [Guyparkeria sp. 1SP6A2]